mgnify:CR=1 FL=1
MTKNLTPRAISLYTALLVSAIVGIITLLFKSNWLELLAIIVLVFVSSYFVFLYALEFFIYRKIKLVYKNIHNLKTQKADGNSPTLSSDPIANVSNEVMDWAADKKTEIDQLKKLEKFRKEFLGNVSHELKTPIFNIQGYILTLLDGALDDKEVHVHFLKKAAKSIDRIATLVEDLEAITQLESGELTMEMETFNILDLVQDVFDSLESKASEKKITFDFKEGTKYAFIVEADKDRVQQILINLITNSIKYGKTGGKTVVGFYDMDENILIEVTDNGLGIEEEHLARLFERFYRVDKSRSREVGGTGLGLSIVKHLIEAHKQTINVRSSIGVGSTFGFTLTKA